ncbi:MAG TPA: carboxypeptidase-like regulatory domain-containing protein [Blastocatellia bacterium]|nr:carboxypeptidase-like regulatory domain-containing protein [Blastocatellia bacterium]
MKNAFAIGLMLLLLGASAIAQTTAAAKSDKRAGTISGRLTDTSGQPLPHALVYVTGASSLRRETRNTSTDEQGRFRVTDLARGVYNVWPGVPGYVTVEGETARRTYRAGDTANFTLTKGGVITGTVTTPTNEPLTGCGVQAIRVRDKDGHAVTISRSSGFASTDDRGVYRIYGLLSGTYVVFASGKRAYMNEASIYENDMPTYYPSSTRDTTQPISVQAGEEASGIDIRYRGERGHAISGKLAGVPADINMGVSLELYNVASRAMEAQGFAGNNFPGSSIADGYAFYGVADGDYLVTATTNSFNSSFRGSGRAYVKVRGADVTGIDLPLTAYGSIAGTLLIEPVRSAEGQNKCEIKRRLMPDEMLVAVRPEKQAAEFHPYATGVRNDAPSDKGEFAFTGLEAGQYRVLPAMLGEDYFVRSMTLPAPAKNQPPVDAARSPLTIKAGERLGELTVTVAEGAAALRGRVVPATEGARLPDRLRVHLVPAEKEAAGDVLRYGEARVAADGAFTFQNLAPGRYLIIARPSADDDTSDEAPPPVAWNAAARATLLKQAAAANLTLDLQPCQRLTDYALKYTPPAPLPVRKKNP